MIPGTFALCEMFPAFSRGGRSPADACPRGTVEHGQFCALFAFELAVAFDLDLVVTLGFSGVPFIRAGDFAARADVLGAEGVSSVPAGRGGE